MHISANLLTSLTVPIRPFIVFVAGYVDLSVGRSRTATRSEGLKSCSMAGFRSLRFERWARNIAILSHSVFSGNTTSSVRGEGEDFGSMMVVVLPKPDWICLGKVPP